jgi:hypothetical protein
MNAVDYHDNTLIVDLDAKGHTAVLLHEDLARARMRESQRTAADERLARRLSTARRWQRLATWAGRHATTSTESL